MQTKKVSLAFAVTGHIWQIVNLRAGLTENQLRDGLQRGVYKTTINGTKIVDTVTKKWVATIQMSGPDDDFTLSLSDDRNPFKRDSIKAG